MLDTDVNVEKFYKDLKPFIRENYEELNFGDINIAEMMRKEFTEGRYLYIDPEDNTRVNGAYYIEVEDSLEDGGLEVVVQFRPNAGCGDYNEVVYYYNGETFEEK